MGMADPVPGYRREFDQEAIRSTKIDELAVKKTAFHMKEELDYQDIRNTLKRKLDDDDYWEHIASCLSVGNIGGLFDAIFSEVEADVYMWKTTEATEEIDNGPEVLDD
jgi:hypothetical protein